MVILSAAKDLHLLDPTNQPDRLMERLTALRDRVAEETEILRRMLADMEKRRIEPGTARSSFAELVKREEFDALEARVVMLERSARGRP